MQGKGENYLWSPRRSSWKAQSEDSRHDAHFPLGNSRPQLGQSTGKGAGVEKGGAKSQGRRGSGMQGRAPRASTNQNALRRRPITARLAWQICPAVRGGAARVPGPPVTLRRAFQESTGQGAEKPGRRVTGRPSLCTSPVTPTEAPRN